MYIEDIEYFTKPIDKPNHDLYKAISRLNSPYREIVQLHIYDEYSLKDIGEKLGKSESYARVMFHRAKNMLRKEIEKDEM
jgi:RNA polymerase sigma-70 factor (ECF subfamily)